jgi:hypothetical protein
VDGVEYHVPKIGLRPTVCDTVGTVRDPLVLEAELAHRQGRAVREGTDTDDRHGLLSSHFTGS